jgi:glucosamine--fructose-6-phosphate aminotransferase (isomerizing)
VPVLAVVGGGPAGESMRGVLDRLRERRADLVVVGPGGAIPTSGRGRAARGTAGHPAAANGWPSRWRWPAARIPDAPRALRKVTATL